MEQLGRVSKLFLLPSLLFIIIFFSYTQKTKEIKQPDNFACCLVTKEKKKKEKKKPVKYHCYVLV